MIKKSVFVLAIMVLLSGSALAEGPVKLKWATFEPPQSYPNVEIFKPWIAKINAEAAGSMEIEFYPGGTLGRDAQQQLKLVTDGVADMAWVINSYQPGRFADDLVTNVPFTAENALEASLATYRMFKKGMLRGYDGIEVLGLFTLSMYYSHTNFPLKTPDDMKGKKLRSGGKMQHALIEACGGAPVAVPTPQTAEAMSRGVIDGTIHEWGAMRIFRINDLAKHHCIVPWGTNTVMIAMNKKSYDKLPAKAKAVLDKHKGEPLVRLFATKWDAYAEGIAKDIKNDSSHTYYVPSNDHLKQWKAKFDPIVSKWKKETENGDKLLKAYEDEIAKIRVEK